MIGSVDSKNLDNNAIVAKFTAASTNRSCDLHLYQPACNIHVALSSLASLLDILRARGADIERFDGLVDYTPYAVHLRYELADLDTPINRSETFEQVESLFTEVRQRLVEAKRI